ncbi:uncharacterized protein LOC116530270 isoform X2 [Sapajus apella]|uniref:Uncharacterized protein LOC116530270 isoform X1 n=1 Tax=Sapajus apella TaxID=9515 RepID=A0A6J3FER1_SAPAP|nr:uncharacterized protein LOC116530270 isoform X1 [Sapajus apella]XP_032104180.1 uncharacterized protein LOC116530270 isoform X2 [Sapajus apella]
MAAHRPIGMYFLSCEANKNPGLSQTLADVGMTCQWRGATHCRSQLSTSGLWRAVLSLKKPPLHLTLQLSTYFILPGCEIRTRDPLNGRTERAVTQTGLKHAPTHHVIGNKKERRREELPTFVEPRPRNSLSQGYTTLFGALFPGISKLPGITTFASASSGSCLQCTWSSHSFAGSQHPCWCLELLPLAEHNVCPCSPSYLGG